MFKYVSLGSICGAVSLSLFSFLYRDPVYTIFAAIAASLVIARHIPNIRRLFSGTEHKFGRKIVIAEQILLSMTIRNEHRG